jgi:hypothetical protein
MPGSSARGVGNWNATTGRPVDRLVDALMLARTLAIVNTVVDAVVVWGIQRSYDLPRSRRLMARCALGAGVRRHAPGR